MIKQEMFLIIRPIWAIYCQEHADAGVKYAWPEMTVNCTTQGKR